MNRCAYRTISALEMVVFKKIMNLSSAAKSQLDAGKVANLASIDVMTVYNFTTFSFFLITSRPSATRLPAGPMRTADVGCEKGTRLRLSLVLQITLTVPYTKGTGTDSASERLSME